MLSPERGQLSLSDPGPPPSGEEATDYILTICDFVARAQGRAHARGVPLCLFGLDYHDGRTALWGTNALTIAARESEMAFVGIEGGTDRVPFNGMIGRSFQDEYRLARGYFRRHCLPSESIRGYSVLPGLARQNLGFQIVAALAVGYTRRYFFDADPFRNVASDSDRHTAALREIEFLAAHGYDVLCLRGAMHGPSLWARALEEVPSAHVVMVNSAMERYACVDSSDQVRDLSVFADAPILTQTNAGQLAKHGSVVQLFPPGGRIPTAAAAFELTGLTPDPTLTTIAQIEPARLGADSRRELGRRYLDRQYDPAYFGGGFEIHRPSVLYG
jgi:hypothetical protein